MPNKYYKIVFTHDNPRTPWAIDEHVGHATVAVHGYYLRAEDAIKQAERLPVSMPVVLPEGVRLTRSWSGQ